MKTMSYKSKFTMRRNCTESWKERTTKTIKKTNDENDEDYGNDEDRKDDDGNENKEDDHDVVNNENKKNELYRWWCINFLLHHFIL